MTASGKYVTHVCPTCGGRGHVVSGKWLRARRVEAGLTLREMARRLEFSAPYISDVELGRRAATPKIVEAYEALS